MSRRWGPRDLINSVGSFRRVEYVAWRVGRDDDWPESASQCWFLSGLGLAEGSNVAGGFDGGGLADIWQSAEQLAIEPVIFVAVFDQLKWVGLKEFFVQPGIVISEDD